MRARVSVHELEEVREREKREGDGEKGGIVKKFGVPRV